MARNILPYPAQPYNGSYSSKAFNSGRGAQKGEMVSLSLVWASYSVNGASLGLTNPNFSVNFDLNTAGPSTVSGTWTVQSVYIDNEGVDFPVYVYFNDTLFTISCPANSAGWYPVYTNGRQGIIAGLGIDNVAIAQNQMTRLFFTDVMMDPSLDQEVQSAVDLGLASQVISFGGTGGGVTSVVASPTGSGYNNGNLNVAGGGGSGMTCHGVLNQYGQFIQVIVDTPGTGYVGPPTITPTGGQGGVILAFNNATNYAVGNFVSYNGFYWIANSPVQAGNGNPPNAFNQWSNTGIAVNAVAGFISTVAPITGGSSINASGNYGARALGDQAKNYIDNVSVPGVFRDNLWGTPYGSGFIYLTAIFVAQLNHGPLIAFQIEDHNNNVFLQFETNPTGESLLFELQGCNIKLPATSTWRLNATSVASALNISNGFAFTYSQF